MSTPHKFPRVASLVLAAGGSLWALMLLWYTFGFLHYSAGFAFLWVLIWLPGFFAWYGYIRRVFGHFLFRRAVMTWVVSVVANTWSLFFLWSYFDRGAFDLPIMVCIALCWIVLAIGISITCLVQERGLREPMREAATHADNEEFRRLLDEHRRNDG